MKIIRASVLGFCFGVRRAVEYAEKAVEENSDKKVYSLGPVIHNETVMKKLEEKGLKTITENEIQKLDENCVVIIRSHGVTPKVMQELENKGCKIINATCPKVMASQKFVKKYSEEGKIILFAGDKNHGEVKGIEGNSIGPFILLENKESAKDLSYSDNEAVLLSQTTFSEGKFLEIAKELEGKYKSLKIQNTICSATNERQAALEELCKKVDGVLVIGGKNSANCARLFQKAENLCKKAFLVQSAEEIPEEFFELEKIGITAAASTPDFVINEVEAALKNSVRL